VLADAYHGGPDGTRWMTHQWWGIHGQSGWSSLRAGEQRGNWHGIASYRRTAFSAYSMTRAHGAIEAKIPGETTAT
jgi:hypothetical protein